MQPSSSMLCYKDGLYRCTKCGYVCNYDREATFHNDKHLYILPRYECLGCLENVSSRRHLLEHFQNFHDAPFPESCLLRVISTVNGWYSFVFMFCLIHCYIYVFLSCLRSRNREFVS